MQIFTKIIFVTMIAGYLLWAKVSHAEGQETRSYQTLDTIEEDMRNNIHVFAVNRDEIYIASGNSIMSGQKLNSPKNRIKSVDFSSTINRLLNKNINLVFIGAGPKISYEELYEFVVKINQIYVNKDLGLYVYYQFLPPDYFQRENESMGFLTQGHTKVRVRIK